MTTASDAHAGGELDLDDLQWEKGALRPMRTYGEPRAAAQHDHLAAEPWRRSEALTATRRAVPGSVTGHSNRTGE